MNIENIERLFDQLPAGFNTTLSIPDRKGDLKRPTFGNIETRSWSKHGTGWETQVKRQVTPANTLRHYAKLHPEHGIGIIINENSKNLVCLDLDYPTDEKNSEAFEYYLDKFKEITYVERSMSGNGYHIIFFSDHKPTQAKLHRLTKIENFNNESVTNKFVAITGNVVSGDTFIATLDTEWDDFEPHIPQVVITPQDMKVTSQNNSMEEMAAYLDLLPTFEDRDQWMRVGFALAHKYGEEAVDIFVDWSVKDGYPIDGQQEWYLNECGRTHENPVTIGTLFEYIREADGENYSKLVRKFSKGIVIRPNTQRTVNLPATFRDRCKMPNQYIKFTEEYETGEGDKAKRVVPCYDSVVEEYLESIDTVVKYNLLTTHIEVNGTRPPNLDNTLTQLAQGLERCGSKWTREKLFASVSSIASAHSYNPMRDWIESKPWDGMSRIKDLENTIPVGDSDINSRSEFLISWLRQGIWGLFHPRPLALGLVLVFKGPQRSGKSEWFSTLMPKELTDSYFGSGISIDPNNNDSLMQATAKWICELGEVESTFRKADIEALKAFLTRPTDEFRKPYERSSLIKRRYTIFGGSANTKEFLLDATGNRRFLVLENSGKLDIYHKVDMQQLWAEVLHEYQEHGVISMSQDACKLQMESNLKFTSQSELEESFIAAYVDNDNPVRTKLTKKAILGELNLLRCGSKERAELATLMDKYNFEIRKNQKNTYYVLPRPKSLLI